MTYMSLLNSASRSKNILLETCYMKNATDTGDCAPSTKMLANDTISIIFCIL